MSDAESRRMDGPEENGGILLRKIIEISGMLSEITIDTLDYEKITWDMLELSGAKCVAFNLFEENGQDFVTVGLAGLPEDLNKAREVLGFDPVGRIWGDFPPKNEKIKDQNVTSFNCLSDLTGGVLAPQAVQAIESGFGIGQVIVVKIIKDNISSGDFTLFMEKENSLFSNEIVELYANQVGLLLAKLKAEKELLEGQKRREEEQEKMKNILEGTHAGTWKWNVQTGETIFNEAWAEIVGYTLEELSPIDIHTWGTLVHPEDLENSNQQLQKVFRQEEEYYSVECRMKHKNGNWVWVMDRGKVATWTEDGKPLEMFGVHIDITERKELMEELIEQKDELERFFSVNLDLLCIADINGNFLKLNKAWETTLGYDLDTLLTMNFLELIHPEDVKKTLEAMSILEGQDQVVNFVNRYRCKDGSYLHLEWKSHPYGNLIYGAARDVTSNKMLEDSLFLEKEIFRTTLLSVGDGVIATDHKGFVTILNQNAQELTGWEYKEAQGRSLGEIFNLISDSTREGGGNLVYRVIKKGETLELGDFLLIARNGVEIPVEITAAPIQDSAGLITGIVIVFRDITDKKNRLQQVEYLSFHDYLTGLYNGRYMEDAISRLNTARNIPFSIIALDVNGLKLTNDAFGHDMGDRLLRSVALILSEACRVDDIICRVGGDEFVVLLPGTDEEQAEHISQRIRKAAAKEKLDSLIVSIAIGHATKQYISEDIGEIKRLADNDMYRDKLKTSKAMKIKTIEKILKNIGLHYLHESSHLENVALFSVAIGKELGMNEAELEALEKAAELHDTGKIILPAEVLNRDGPLTPEEFELVKRHSDAGYQILKTVDEYAPLAEYILYHHERIDGEGYPSGLIGEEIPIQSRILCVADAYEAMTGQRTYKPSRTQEDALLELERCAGTQFDAAVVAALIKILKNKK